MIISCLIFLFLCNIVLGIVFYFLHLRVEDLSEKLLQINNKEVILNDNQTTLQAEIKRLFNEFQFLKKHVPKKEIRHISS